MGIFGLFGNKKEKSEAEEKEIPWHLLNSVEQLDQIKKESASTLVVIFKHSTRCPTSRMALRAFEKGFDSELQGVKLYILDLLNEREVSDEIAHQFQVWHESPQLILIKDGKAVHYSSHSHITAAIIEEFVD